MPVNDIIAKRKRLQDDEGDDFTVGNIAGLDDSEEAQVVKELNENTKAKKTAKTTTKKNEESVADMTTATIEKNNVKVTENITAEMLEGTVSLKVKQSNTALINLLINKNDGVIVEECENCYKLHAKQIRVTRQDVESALGKMNDGRWRMLFMNREGELSAFNDYEFVLGIIATEVEERKEQAQLNTRILAEAKMEMDEVRDLLGMTQAQFLEVAIREFAEKVKAEML